VKPIPSRAVDEDANAIVPGRGGVWDIGVIESDAAKVLRVAAGPIRLLYGFHAGHKGWGLQHIVQREDRVRAIKGAGYENCKEFVWDVAEHWTEIHAAAEPGRIKAVWPKGGLELGIVLQWTGKVWSVTTALPFRADGKPKLYVRGQTA